MSILNHALQGKRVLVTGATGFIGGRLAQRLAVEEGAKVTGSGRQLEAAAYLQTAGVTLQRADLQQAEEMAALVQGQEVIFHVAAWLSDRHGEEAAAYAINVEATRRLAQQAAAAGVARFVHVSSIAAYGPPLVPLMDEGQPVDASQRNDVYGRTKAAGELAALAVGQATGLAVTIGRPAMVYGPRSMTWSVGMLRLVKRRVPTLVGDGSGHALPVYVDNLVDGLLLAAARPEAVGEAFNFCDPPVPWRTFFGYYGAMCGRRPIAIPHWAVKGLVWANQTFRLGMRLTPERVRFLTARTVYPFDKARRLLGYEPRVDIETGMGQTEVWLRQAGYL